MIWKIHHSRGVHIAVVKNFTQTNLFLDARATIGVTMVMKRIMDRCTKVQQHAQEEFMLIAQNVKREYLDTETRSN